MLLISIGAIKNSFVINYQILGDELVYLIAWYIVHKLTKKLINKGRIKVYLKIIAPKVIGI